jgi:hypothetical protein
MVQKLELAANGLRRRSLPAIIVTMSTHAHGRHNVTEHEAWPEEVSNVPSAARPSRSFVSDMR